ncbi:NAD-dependent epimerase/dehydratase family protein [Pareuzebyella sediminis]|uniref:NAD-dependent epimerase/dehydratase family protein n=1 Tax=Pareuzebyella sediminis TaxID=2607998 RepID=UPI0011EFD08E|nr:NAD-dependent epimerase/dehydratase family protein [Pareuzebyella sediminis]
MILITGGTGLLGSHLLLQLVENYPSVRAIHRKESDLKRVEKVFGYYRENAPYLFKKIDWVETDINDIPALEKAFRGVTHVYHAAALISFDPANYKKLQKINTEGTANIVNLCITHSIEKLCYASTVGAIGKSMDGAKTNEENPWTPHEANVYGLTKQAAEMEVWRGSQEGLEVVMVNPGVIIGPGFWDSGSGELFSIAKKGHRYHPPGGTGFVAVNDVVRLMIALMESDIKNERYIAVGENWTYKKILGEICKVFEITPPTKELKFWQLEIGRWFDWLGNLIFKSGRRITKNAIRSLKNREIYDTQKTKRDLGFEFTPLDGPIRFSCAQFKEENP